MRGRPTDTDPLRRCHPGQPSRTRTGLREQRGHASSPPYSPRGGGTPATPARDWEAAGGSFGLSAAQPHPSWALQASRAAGAVIAAAGLLGLAGRSGPRTRLWLPAALAWVGSGSLAAFDGLELLLNLLMSGTGASGSGWSLAGTVLVIEVVIGVSCAAVGAVAVTAAARHDRPARWPGLRRTGPVTGPAAGAAPRRTR